MQVGSGAELLAAMQDTAKDAELLKRSITRMRVPRVVLLESAITLQSSAAASPASAANNTAPGAAGLAGKESARRILAAGALDGEGGGGSGAPAGSSGGGGSGTGPSNRSVGSGPAPEAGLRVLGGGSSVGTWPSSRVSLLNEVVLTPPVHEKVGAPRLLFERPRVGCLCRCRCLALDGNLRWSRARSTHRIP